jgi:predicted amino acid racemase
MAELRIKTDKILGNIRKLDRYLVKHDKKWTLVTKVLSGHRESLKRILAAPCIKRLHSVADSRLSGLRTVKQLNPELVTMYIKPPAVKLAEKVVRFADISLNTSFETIAALDRAARLQGKVHRVVVMIEMGELREGVIRENIYDFYERVLQLDNITICGLGSNLGCMYGVEPTYDKLIQLCLYLQLLELRFNINLELVSGGSSITLPLLGKRKIPRGMNHFRIGEAAFFGVSPLTGKRYRDLSTDSFEFVANVLELEEKTNVPQGNIGEGNVGHAAEFDEEAEERQYRAVLDFGIVDVDPDQITPHFDKAAFAGTTSDMTVYNVGDNRNPSGRRRLREGGTMSFTPNYMGVARLMHSKYVEKRVS